MTALLLVAVGYQPAPAAQWDFDRAHSSVYFDVKHIASTIRGIFADYDGTIVFDPSNPEQGSMTFVIKTASIDTGITKRDDHLRTADFFAAEKFPEISFESATIREVGANRFVVNGALTIKGKTYPIDVPMKFYPAVPDPFDPSRQVAGFDFRFTVDRLAYGVGDGRFHKMGVVGKNVDVFISLEMIRNE